MEEGAGGGRADIYWVYTDSLKLRTIRQATMTVVLLLSFRIDMYSEGLADLNEMFILYPFDPPGVKEANIALMKEKAKNRYFPAFEKVCGSCLNFKSINIISLIQI